MSGTLTGHTVWSAANRRRLEHWAWVPDGDGPFPLLVLLHGVYDAGGFVWWQQGRAHETAARLIDTGEIEPLVIVMPTDGGVELGSGYCDWADGTARIETYIIDELLTWCGENLPVANTKRWIGGLSMGGYGSLMLALRHPGLFAAATSTSGFFDPGVHFEYIDNNASRMWGSDEVRDQHDVRLLMRDPARRDGLRMLFDCGVDDVRLPENRAMHALLEDLGIEHKYSEHPGGHTWDYWESRLPDHLRFLAGSR